MEEDNLGYEFTDEMIEGLVENPKFKVGDRVKWFNYTCNITSIDTDKDTYTYLIKHNDYREDESFAKWVPESELTFNDDKETSIKLTGKAIKNSEMVVSIGEYTLPEGYIFKDENGNVINTNKIVLEKKEKEYPKTYEECCKIMGVNHTNDLDICEHCDYKTEITYYEDNLLEKIESLYRLIICRDAYWKIAGEEMGLGKPWEPDWGSFSEGSYPTITKCNDRIVKTSIYTHDCILAFPTEEMRDAFYENFKELIEQCKELL